MKPEDVPADLTDLGRKALYKHLMGLTPRTRMYLPTYEERVRVVLAASLPEYERQLRAEQAETEARRERDVAEAERLRAEGERLHEANRRLAKRNSLGHEGYKEIEAERNVAEAEAERLRGELDALKAACLRVRAVCQRAIEQTERPGWGRMFGGGPFPANVNAADVLAALDGPTTPEGGKEFPPRPEGRGLHAAKPMIPMPPEPTDCALCKHPADVHDAGECWAKNNSDQCTCWWYAPIAAEHENGDSPLTDPTERITDAATQIANGKTA